MFGSVFSYIVTFQIVFFIFIFALVIIALINNGKKGPKKGNIDVSNKYYQLAYSMIEGNPEIEEARALVLKRSKVRKSIAVLILAVAIFLGGVTKFPPIGVFSFIFMLIIMLIVTGKMYPDNYQDIFYNRILTTLVRKYNETFTYNHFDGIGRRLYDMARLDFYDRYHSEDLITGKIEGLDFCMSDVHTEDESEDSDGNTTYTTSFLGTFATIELNKSINSYILIGSNRLKLGRKDEYVTIDNEEFEKSYDVFSNNQILALRLLTPDVTFKILELEKETNITTEIKIENNRVYMRLFTGDNFGLAISNPEEEARVLGYYISILDSIYKIMENIIKEINEVNE